MKVGESKRGDTLLKILTTIGNAAIAFSRHPSRNAASVYRMARDFRELQDISDRELRSMSRYIIENKYITIHKGSVRNTIEITEKGKARIARGALFDLKPRRAKKWDRKWRIVLFDVPNHMKSARDAFAATLKSFGFERLQKSVFICPYPCEEELKVVADYFDISECVDIIVAEHISRESEFKKLFDLK